ncbi:MAG: family 20 glycosylhydrolase [Bacteroidaceae bacterium]|nr:family 20 glycosylhydrolase [Bacteroidaceae bacterium]
MIRIAFIVMLGLMFSVGTMGQNPKPFVIPELKQWQGATGTFQPTAATHIVVAEKNAKLMEVAQQLAKDYQTMFGTTLPVTTEKAAKQGDIILNLKAKKLSNEAYKLTIADNVTLSSTTIKGAYWGTRTLLQLSDLSEDHSLPCGEALDQPDWEIRGFMFDVARKYIPLNYLEQLVQIMSYLKMNTLQVHLNDDSMGTFPVGDWTKSYSAFRLECDTYPGLTARDGYYTKEQFRNFQRMAQKYHVEIIPELDAPAHSLAFTKYDNTLGSEEFGMDHLNLRNPKVTPFLENLWKEYIEGDDPVFIGPKVDIGTDEYSNRDSLVSEAFRKLADDLIKYVEGYGKQAVLWGSLTHSKGKTKVKSENVIMSLWYNGYANPEEMKREGFKFISVPDAFTYIVPRAGYYYDYLNIQHLYEKWTPNIVADVTFDYSDPCILGGMFALWNDIVGNGISVKDLHHRILPAMQTLSAKFWTGKDVSLTFAEFNKHRQQLREAPGVNEEARVVKPHSEVLALQQLQPQSQQPIKEIGYDYTVSFRWQVKPEQPGTILLQSPNAVFYLADPINGRLGYSRDGYLFTFNFKPYATDRDLRITITGNDVETRLYVDGKLMESKRGHTIYCDGGKRKSEGIETLVFPLQQSGNFKSQITDFKVYNYFDAKP